MPTLLPASAPFAADEIAVLNSVISTTTAEQRAWLSGYLAGLQAANDPMPADAAAPPAAKIPLTILFGTESGNAEALASQARKVAARLGFAAKIVDMADFNVAQAADTENLLIVASTWGEGDPPQRAVDFYDALLAEDAPSFSRTRYAVLALGDRAYSRFCEVGQRIDARLAELGGARIAERIDCDVDFQLIANGWIDDTLQRLSAEADAPSPTSVIHVDFARSPVQAPSRASPYAAEITEHVRLSGSRSSSDTWHVAVSLEGSGITYEPGDALGVMPSNDPDLVAAILETVKPGEEKEAVRHALQHRLDITTLTSGQIQDFCRLTDTPLLPEPWRQGRQVIDLLESAPGRLSAEQLTTLLRPLQPRYYSIASSREAVGEEAHLLVAGVRYSSQGRNRSGVASIDITARHRAGDRLNVFVRPNPHFRLPADPDQAIIMIGPGTGVAPFRGFLQQREAASARGRNWLVYGHRQYLHDFLYQTEWQDWTRSGLLNRLDVAFSRDQPEKHYVQDALWAARKDLYSWIQDGASLYVCGDANAMAKDVHSTLLRVLADQGHLDPAGAQTVLDSLRRSGRYLRDVY